MSNAVEFTNLDAVLQQIGKDIEGQIRIDIDMNKVKGNTKYRANWNLKDAGDHILTEGDIAAAVSDWVARKDKSWESGGNFLQVLSREIQGEYVDRVLSDKKTSSKEREAEARAIRVMEERR